jgi:hypothetical protein
MRGAQRGAAPGQSSCVFTVVCPQRVPRVEKRAPPAPHVFGASLSAPSLLRFHRWPTHALKTGCGLKLLSSDRKTLGI